MSLNALRTNYVANQDFSRVNWKSATKKLLARAAVRADSRGVLNVERNQFFRDALKDEYNPKYVSHMMSDCNKVEHVTFSAIGHGASARLIVVFDDEKIRKVMEEQEN